MILLLLILSGSCLADKYKYSYQLIGPDGSTTYRLTVTITDALYDYYKNQDHVLYNSDFSTFVTPDALKPIADDLWAIYDNEEDFANGVLTIVHQIPYLESEPQIYPVETMVENNGDCDLFTIIAASIMKAGGIDVVLLLLEQYDHMLLGVHLSESPKNARSQIYFYRYNEQKYYVAETTGGHWQTGWRVGECPEILQRSYGQVMPLANYEQKAPAQVSSSYVIPDSSSVHMSLSTNFVVNQQHVEISGVLSPSLDGETITLYVGPMGSPLVMLAPVLTDTDGKYSYVWESPAGGIYAVRARWSGNDDYNSADSNTFEILVLPTELLTVGLLIIISLLILMAITLVTRNAPLKTQGSFEDWDFVDYSEDF
jgi:hypothetical protein